MAGVTFDDLVERGEINVEEIGLVWIDTQGHEGYVLSGAEKLTSANIPVVTEYWPDAIEKASGWELLETAIRTKYSHFLDLRMSDSTEDAEPVESSRISEWRTKYVGVNLTDLLLMKLP